MEGSLVAYKVFTNGSVLQASEINDNLMNQSVIVFTNSAARSAAIPTPLEGMITYQLDTQRYETYNGTSFVPLSSGFDLIKSQTIGSAVSSVVVTGAFSADYDNYRFLMDTNIGSATNVGTTLSLGGVATGYYGSRSLVTYGGVQTLIGTNNSTTFAIGAISTNGGSFSYDIITPFLETRTSIQGNNVYRLNTTNGYVTNAGGFQNSDTSFTDFTLTFGGGTVTGGSIEVYGYKKA